MKHGVDKFFEEFFQSYWNGLRSDFWDQVIAEVFVKTYLECVAFVLNRHRFVYL